MSEKQLHSRNAYEHDCLVDAYDFEKRGDGFVRGESGMIPKQFGSSGGDNFDRVLGLLQKDCGPQSRILEVGCGAGAFYKTLKVNDKAYRYVGIDKSKRQIGRCLDNYPEGDFRVGDVCYLSLDDHSFDFVFENNVLIFTTDPCKAIDEMCRVSRGYVYFLIDVVNAEHGLYCYYPFSSIATHDPKTNCVSVSPEERNFFGNGRFRYKEMDDGKVLAMTAKVPIYVPGVVELYESLKESIGRYGMTVEWEHDKLVRKEVWMNAEKSSSEILNDDCVVSRNDRLVTLDAVNLGYVLKKN